MASNGTGTKDSRREATCGTFLAPWALTVLMVVPMDLAGAGSVVLGIAMRQPAGPRWAPEFSLPPHTGRLCPRVSSPPPSPSSPCCPPCPLSLSLPPPPCPGLPLGFCETLRSAFPPPRPPPALPPGRVAGPARSFVLLLSSRLPARPCPPLVSVSGFPSEALMPSLWPFGAMRLRTSSWTLPAY